MFGTPGYRRDSYSPAPTSCAPGGAHLHLPAPDEARPDPARPLPHLPPARRTRSRRCTASPGWSRCAATPSALGTDQPVAAAFYQPVPVEDLLRGMRPVRWRAAPASRWCTASETEHLRHHLVALRAPQQHLPPVPLRAALGSGHVVPRPRAGGEHELHTAGRIDPTPRTETRAWSVAALDGGDDEGQDPVDVVDQVPEASKTPPSIRGVVVHPPVIWSVHWLAGRQRKGPQEEIGHHPALLSGSVTTRKCQRWRFRPVEAWTGRRALLDEERGEPGG